MQARGSRALGCVALLALELGTAGGCAQADPTAIPSAVIETAAHASSSSAANGGKAVSAVVSSGRVVATVSHRSGPEGEPGIHTEVSLEPSQSNDSGAPSAPAITFWVPGGQVGRLRRVVSHVPAFSVGQQVAVQLAERRHAYWYLAPRALGAATVQGAPLDRSAP